MRPNYHVVVSFAGIPVYILTKSFEMALCFTIAEIVIDVDHLFDHVIFDKRRFSLTDIFKKNNASQWSHIVFFLHSYELIIALGAISFWFKNKILLAITAGMFFHLILDEIGNRLPSTPVRINKLFYFFTFRILNRFQTDKITKGDIAGLKNYGLK